MYVFISQHPVFPRLHAYICIHKCVYNMFMFVIIISTCTCIHAKLRFRCNYIRRNRNVRMNE